LAVVLVAVVLVVAGSAAGVSTVVEGLLLWAGGVVPCTGGAMTGDNGAGAVWWFI
jgi:hypothetical protein